jgi:hypothetical protein
MQGPEGAAFVPVQRDMDYHLHFNTWQHFKAYFRLVTNSLAGSAL